MLSYYTSKCGTKRNAKAELVHTTNSWMERCTMNKAHVHLHSCGMHFRHICNFLLPALTTKSAQFVPSTWHNQQICYHTFLSNIGSLADFTWTQHQQNSNQTNVTLSTMCLQAQHVLKQTLFTNIRPCPVALCSEDECIPTRFWFFYK